MQAPFVDWDPRSAGGVGSGQSRLAIGGGDGEIRDRLGKPVVLGLEPHDLVFEVAYALLQTPQFLDHTRVRTSDVTKQSFCHDYGSSTLSDQRESHTEMTPRPGRRNA